LRPFVTELAGRVARHRVETVCGPLNGGAFLAELIASGLGVEFAFAERTISQRAGLFPIDYRVPTALRAGLRGKRVAIVDDAISMGSAIRATAADIELCKARPVVIGALLGIGPGASEFATASRLPFERIADLPIRTWVPSACQLCASGRAVADP